MTGRPLLEAQEGLWLSRRLDPGNPTQNTGKLLHLEGILDLDAFRYAVARTFHEADGLRLMVAERGGEPCLEGGLPGVSVPLVEHGGDPLGPATLREQVRRDMERPRQPWEDPVTSILYRMGPSSHAWYLCMQHLVVDGYGTHLVLARVLELYRERVGGEPAGPPFLPFSAVADEDAAYRCSPRREEDRRYWIEAMEGMSPVPSLAAGVPLAGHRIHRVSRLLPPGGAAALERVAQQAGATWPDAAVALVSAYLGRHLGGDEAVVGVPAMNRMGSPAARVPAMVMNVLPLRVPLVPEDATTLTASVASALARGRRHARFRGEQIRRDLGLVGERRRLHGPLVNVLPFFHALPTVPGLRVELEVLGTGPVDDLTLTLRGHPASSLLLEVEANAELHDAAAVEAHLHRLSHFLEAAGTTHDLRAVPTLTPMEEAHWVRGGLNGRGGPGLEGTLRDRMECAFTECPGAPALEGDGERLTYKELDARTAALGDALHEAGAGPGGVVAILLPRSLRQVVAIHSVVRAGAAYLPLDPDHPPSRLADLVAEARAVAVVADAGWEGRLPGAARIIEVERGGWPVAALPERPGVRRDPDPSWPVPSPCDPAYLIYTSGSTGRPKGVVVEHSAIVNRLEWMRAEFDFGGDDRILYKTPATFDVSVWELFLPMICVGTLVVAPPGAHRDPRELAGILRDQAITTVHFVPSMLAAFLDHPAGGDLNLRRVFCSGEALTAPLRDRFHHRIRGELHNLYGPTEAAVDVTHWPAPASDRSDPVPLGRPVWHTRLYVLDPSGRPVPPGVEGELHIGGRQVARGYLGRPELTAERFPPNPWGAPGERMYRTGDLARWRPDGALLFGGRIDHQVKVRGQRVEPGEIEAALRSVPGVSEAVVILRDDLPGEAGLVGYVVPEAGASPPEPEALRAELARTLPEVMVPGDLVVIPALPLGPSGKLDRGALPLPRRTPRGTGGSPATATEASIAGLFQEILGLHEPPGTAEDFFTLGGHSLAAIRLSAALHDELGLDPGPAAVFVHPTPGRLAAHLDRATEAPGAVVPLTPPDHGRGGAPLHCLHPAGGIAWCYSPLARALTTPRPVLGLQARGLDPAAPLPSTLEAMAADYLDTLMQEHPGGPVHLLGWSMGGIVAHAMAVRLQQQGGTPGLVALLDAYPADRWRAEADPGEDAGVRALLLMAGRDPDAPVDTPWTRARLVELLRREGHPLGGLPRRTLEGVVRVVGNNSRLVREHRHGRLSGPVVHIRAGVRKEGEASPDPGEWAPYVETLHRFELPLGHADLATPAAAPAIARILEPFL